MRSVDHYEYDMYILDEGGGMYLHGWDRRNTILLIRLPDLPVRWW